MLPASLAACVPVFIATATSACASAGASLVPSPVIATMRPLGLVVADQLQLRLGRGLGEEVVDAGLGRDRGGGEPVVAGDHHGLDAHAAQLGEALLDAALDDVLELDDAENLRLPVAHDQRGVLPLARDTSSTAVACTSAGKLPPSASHVLAPIASAAPLRSWRTVPPPSSMSTPLMRVCAENGTKVVLWHGEVAFAQVELLLGEHDRRCGPRASRRRATRTAPRRRAPDRSRPWRGTNAEAWRLPSVMVPVLSSSSTSTSPAASTARPEVAITLARPSCRLMPATPIADSSAPIVVGIRHTSSAISTVIVTGVPSLAATSRR